MLSPIKLTYVRVICTEYRRDAPVKKQFVDKDVPTWL
jgi:hypothetical protein